MLRRRHTPRFAAPLALALLVALGTSAQAAPDPSVSDPSPDVHLTPFSAHPERTPRTAPPLPELESPSAPEGTGYAPDHVLVRFAAKATPGQQRSSLSALGAEVEDTVDGTSWVQVDVGDQDPAAVVAELDTDPQVADVQLDHVRNAFSVPGDPWITRSPYFDLMRLPRAWDASTGAGTVVAILDTGVYRAHDELSGSVLTGTDLVAGDSDPEDARVEHGDDGAGAGTRVPGPR